MAFFFIDRLLFSRKAGSIASATTYSCISTEKCIQQKIRIRLGKMGKLPKCPCCGDKARWLRGK